MEQWYKGLSKLRVSLALLKNSFFKDGFVFPGKIVQNYHFCFLTFDLLNILKIHLCVFMNWKLIFNVSSDHRRMLCHFNQEMNKNTKYYSNGRLRKEGSTQKLIPTFHCDLIRI